ncbi:MAG: GNAT family N-acetyltransferase [Pseudomonadota bacterium]|nr:GNAT family N-acetyltransferase [Pseudomonadota bacterium]
MTEERHFRAYQPDDFMDLVAMATALYQEDPPGAAMNAGKIARTIQALGDAPERGKVVIFEAAGQVVGYAIVILIWSNELSGEVARVDEMYVLPSWRGQQIGTAFFAHLCGQADPILRGLQIETTPNNHLARRLYERLGFHANHNVQLVMSLTGD